MQYYLNIYFKVSAFKEMVPTAEMEINFLFFSCWQWCTLFMVHLWYLSLTQCTSNCWWEALPCQHGRNASVTWILQTKARGTVTVCLRLLNISNRKKNRSLNLLALETYKKAPVLFHKLHCFESSNGHLLVSKSWYLIL